jgi:hypothetical protein
MLSKKSPLKNKKSAKKTIIEEIVLILAGALTPLKEKLGEKKFEKRIAKAAKLLATGVKSAPAKKVASKKVPAKKVTIPATAKSTTKKTTKAEKAS